jgi:hypothetical protein
MRINLLGAGRLGQAYATLSELADSMAGKTLR